MCLASPAEAEPLGPALLGALLPADLPVSGFQGEHATASTHIKEDASLLHGLPLWRLGATEWRCSELTLCLFS